MVASACDPEHFIRETQDIQEDDPPLYAPKVHIAIEQPQWNTLDSFLAPQNDACTVALYNYQLDSHPACPLGDTCHDVGRICAQLFEGDTDIERCVRANSFEHVPHKAVDQATSLSDLNHRCCGLGADARLCAGASAPSCRWDAAAGRRTRGGGGAGGGACVPRRRYGDDGDWCAARSGQTRRAPRSPGGAGGSLRRSPRRPPRRPPSWTPARAPRRRTGFYPIQGIPAGPACCGTTSCRRTPPLTLRRPDPPIPIWAGWRRRRRGRDPGAPPPGSACAARFRCVRSARSSW